MATLPLVIQQDTRANQPLATTVSAGTLFGVTDEGDIIERSDGTNWVNYSPSASQTGTVVQVVNTQTGAVSTGTTTMPMDDTIPQNTEGTEFMTLAITPTSATNKLKIEVLANFATSIAVDAGVALFQDTTADALAASPLTVSGNNQKWQGQITHYMTAGTTSATTFKVRIGPGSAATVTFNGVGGARLYGGVCDSSITITEIVP